MVSIHAPWEGCDNDLINFTAKIRSFNSRTLGRVRRPLIVPTLPRSRFQFTHPGKGATLSFRVVVRVHLVFQFTHPGKGATGFTNTLLASATEFQFTHPGKGAT